MTKLTRVQLARKELEMTIRHEANVARLRILNEILPAALEDFDRRVAEGKAFQTKRPDIKELVAEAIKGSE